jgi:hypothetical protein
LFKTKNEQPTTHNPSPTAIAATAATTGTNPAAIASRVAAATKNNAISHQT